jgi:hypothetical protein
MGTRQLARRRGLILCTYVVHDSTQVRMRATGTRRFMHAADRMVN